MWIAVIACFILLTITVGIKFSWLTIAAALIIQMLVMAGFTKGFEYNLMKYQYKYDSSPRRKPLTFGFSAGISNV
jgi:hypothetical protein